MTKDLIIIFRCVAGTY